MTHTGELVRPAVQAARMEPWHLSLLVAAGSRGDLASTNLLFSCRGEMLPAGKVAQTSLTDELTSTCSELALPLA